MAIDLTDGVLRVPKRLSGQVTTATEQFRPDVTKGDSFDEFSFEESDIDGVLSSLKRVGLKINESQKLLTALRTALLG